ncbi:hypothetical protein [Brevifollis gellanilyticus]|uniref:Uncharacterized protein n=1 Tax=Brevifollis gellanilyticus TaxID=748831 RepID=A0A512MHA6_9BACT|nr:hypothetical protein [Brevifollis gellanilyticus]GEP46106.1 hypothetical protein BGE01nite_53970 [Brevifollis gellanilyticus]
MLALLVLLLLPVWLVGEQALLARSKATAPVVSISEDGKVRIRGIVLRLGTDGLPPAALAELEGAPPVELPAKHEKSEPGCTDVCIRTLVTRTWHYPRLGLTLQIRRTPYIDGSGQAYYHSWLKFGENHPGTLELRGHRLWLGQSTLFDPGLRSSDLLPLRRKEDGMPMDDGWFFCVGGTYVSAVYAYNYNWDPSWLDELILDLGLNPNINNPLLDAMLVNLPSPDNFDSAVWPAEHVVNTFEPIPGREMPAFMKAAQAPQ